MGKMRMFQAGRHTDNSNPAVKIALRRWLLQKFPSPSVLEFYGGFSRMYESLWKSSASLYETPNGHGAKTWLLNMPSVDHQIFDIDPYGSPWEILSLLNEKASQDLIGLAVTENIFRRSMQIRAHMPVILQVKCKFSDFDRDLKKFIFYNYPDFLHLALAGVLDRWVVDRLVIKYAGNAKSITYFSAIISRKEMSYAT